MTTEQLTEEGDESPNEREIVKQHQCWGCDGKGHPAPGRCEVCGWTREEPEDT